MKLAQASRMLWIAGQLDAAGQVSRKDMCAALGISLSSATTDLATFNELFPGAAIGGRGEVYSLGQGTPAIPAFVKIRAVEAARDALYLCNTIEAANATT